MIKHLPLLALMCVTEYRYLGVQITRDVSQYYLRNLLPLLSLPKNRWLAWSGLLLNLLGHINLFKMMLLPKFNYLFRNWPVWIPAAFSCDVDRSLGSFIWNGAFLCLAKSVTPSWATGGVGLIFRCITGRRCWWRHIAGLSVRALMLLYVSKLPV